MRTWSFIAVAAAAFAMGSAAQARRVVVDQDADENPIRATLSGYCDFNGDECDPGGGLNLFYSVNIAGTEFSKVFVQGNGLLTFGEPVDFQLSPVYDFIFEGSSPLLTDYNRTLVSAGQSNTLDFGVFLQSALASVDPITGTITSQFYICGSPTAPGVCPKFNVYSLTLTPSAEGFLGQFDFSSGRAEGTDIGFVSGGQFTSTGNTFLLPASFQGINLASSVPEPTTWAMMLVGFGAVGYSMRRRSAAKPQLA
jgi:hypothetical protein